MKQRLIVFSVLAIVTGAVHSTELAVCINAAGRFEWSSTLGLLTANNPNRGLAPARPYVIGASRCYVRQPSEG